MIPTLHDCRETRLRLPWVIKSAADWWRDERAMWKKHAETGEIVESDPHFGFAFASTDPARHPQFFLTVLTIADTARDNPHEMVQLGLAEMGFFLACCDDAYIALLEALAPESEPLKVLLGYVYQTHGMSDERYVRIRALAPDLNGFA